MYPRIPCEPVAEYTVGTTGLEDQRRYRYVLILFNIYLFELNALHSKSKIRRAACLLSGILISVPACSII
jgi:hypothetical protein